MAIFIKCILVVVFFTPFVDFTSAKTNRDEVMDTVENTVELVEEIMDFINGGEHDMTNDELLEKLVTRIETMQDRTTTDLYRQLSMQVQYKDLENDLLHIENALIDLNFYLRANNESAHARKQRFLSSAVEAVKHARFLGIRLTDTVPGIDNKLLPYLAENSRCNMTTINVFRHFYFNTIASAISIDLLSKTLEDIHSHEQDINYWKDVLELVSLQFDVVILKCMDRFKELIHEDIRNYRHTNVTYLQIDIAQRYSWLWLDVFLLKRHEPVSYLYVELDAAYYTRIPSHSPGIDAVIVNAKKGSNRENVTGMELSVIMDNLLVIGGSHTADIVAKYLRKRLCARRFYPKAMLVFDVNKASSLKFAIDKDPMAISTEMKTPEGKIFGIYMVMIRSNCTEVITDQIESEVSSRMYTHSSSFTLIALLYFSYCFSRCLFLIS